MKPKLDRSVLTFDSLDTAEKITGKSYTKDKTTMNLGFVLHLESAAARERILSEAGDTSMRSKLADYLRIAKSAGFEMVLEHDIVVPAEFKKSYEGEKVNRHYIMWHPEYSILLNFDSYNGNKSINGGSFYYAWRPKDPAARGEWRDCLSSGGMCQDPQDEDANVWVGSHDCREALRFNIMELAKHGTFLKQWPKYPHLWLMHYGDQRLPEELEKNHKAQSGHWDKVNRGYASRLPEHVQKAICFSQEVA